MAGFFRESGLPGNDTGDSRESLSFQEKYLSNCFTVTGALTLPISIRKP